MDGRGEILRLQYLYHTVGHLNNVSLYHILGYQVLLIPSKAADSKLHTSKVALGILCNKNDSCKFLTNPSSNTHGRGRKAIRPGFGILQWRFWLLA